MYCKKCGTQNIAQANYCKHCGTRCSQTHAAITNTAPLSAAPVMPTYTPAAPLATKKTCNTAVLSATSSYAVPMPCKSPSATKTASVPIPYMADANPPSKDADICYKAASKTVPSENTASYNICIVITAAVLVMVIIVMIMAIVITAIAH